MTDNDPFASALSGLNNAERVGQLRHRIQPASNEIANVLEVLFDRGYIAGFERIDDGKAGVFEVELHGAINECGAIKPRYSIAADEFERWERRYLPARDFGALIMTTSEGIMSHYDARDSRVGGQVIAYVY